MLDLAKRALFGLITLQLTLALLLFLPAWSLHFWEAWIYWSLFLIFSLPITLYLLKYDPGLLGRRLEAGPGAETEKSQKVIQAAASVLFCLMMLATPFALGSLWALLPAVALCAVVAVRLLDEERYLSANLPGYEEYCQMVRRRLIPLIW